MADQQLDDVKKGKIVFVQSHRPPLEDGEYVVTVAQTVRNTNANPGADATVDETYLNTRRFQVRGERFTLDETEIESVFPPPGSQGEYENVLPHIVFSRQTLPWERDLGDPAKSTWLALLLFDQNDPVPEVKQILVGDLQSQPFAHAEGVADAPSSLPATAVSYPGLTLEFGELIYQQCLAIDVPVALFDQVVPGVIDMPWLSHARSVTPDNPAALGLEADGPATIDTSVIICNRLPDPGTHCTVHLVSLEGMAAMLPQGDSYQPPGISLPDGQPADTIRLVSLKSWSYRSVDPENTFAGLLKGLDSADNLRVLAINNTSAGTSPADAHVANALQLGYAPVNHQTRQGSATVSWYRGPFVPFAVPSTIFVPGYGEEAASPPIATADEALRYNPDTGMMDISYASAWQIGRLLALQDKGFSEALVNWKRANTLAVVASFERSVLAEKLGSTLMLDSASLGADPAALHHALAGFIRTRLRPHLVAGPAQAGNAIPRDARPKPEAET